MSQGTDVTQSCALDSVTELSSVGCNIDTVRDISSVTIRGDESASLEHSQTSPFAVWSREIMKVASNAVNTCSSKTYECRNKYYFPAVIEKLLMLYMPTLPMWPMLMLNVTDVTANPTVHTVAKWLIVYIRHHPR